MSHNIEYGIYKENINKDKVQKEWDNYVRIADRAEGASGLGKAIRWAEGVAPLNSEEDAYDWVKSHDKGWYDQLAVRFYDVEAVNTAKLDELRKKCSDAQKKWAVKNNVLVRDTRTSAYIGCAKCGSKLSRVHLNRNRCPLCGEDLRSATELKALDNLSKKIDTLKEQARKEEAKQKKKAPVKWLVKIEYHT